MRDWTLVEGDGPLVATAVHAGHTLRPDVAAHMALGSAERLREEDPFTDLWTSCAPTRAVVHTSRFEVDLNRPLEKAVYRVPEDAWGLQLWKGALPDELVADSADKHRAWFDQLKRLCDERVERHGHVVLLDLHSYNHRRSGPAGPCADPEGNPEVNLGTGTMDRARWAALVDRFAADLRAAGFAGRPLDVRENVKFRGGQQCRWLHENYPETGCALAVEFKKFFMDEWTGEPDLQAVAELGDALAATIPGLLTSLSAGREGRA